MEIAEKGLRSLRTACLHDSLPVLERNWRGDVQFVGDTLWPRQEIAELPDLSQLEAEVVLLEADGGRLKTDFKARLMIEGWTGQEHEANLSRVEPHARTRSVHQLAISRGKE